jgi:uncharacterized protein (TIGR02996 family)
MPLYELEEGTSRKFYRIELHDTRVHLNWGRIGSEGQHQVLSHENATAARAEYQRQIDRRLERGYRLVVDEGAPHDPDALDKARLARTGSLSDSPRFLFVHRAKKRFAWVEARGKTVVFASGKASEEATAKPATKTCASTDAALRERDKQVAELMAKGYELETFGAKPAKKPRRVELACNEALEQAIAEDPLDEAAWTVLEDWILQQHDPRAELVRLGKANLHAEEKAALEAAGPSLFGSRHVAMAAMIAYSSWRAGYITDCQYWERSRSDMALAPLFYQTPAARLVRELHLELYEGPSFVAHLAAIAQAPCRHTLRRIVLTPRGEAAPFTLPAERFAAIPQLGALEIGLGGCQLVGDAPIGVSSLSVELDTADVVSSWVDRRYPALRSIRIGLRLIDLPETRGGLVERIAELFTPERLPALERLELHCNIHDTAQAVFARLANSELRPQLRDVAVMRGMTLHAQVEDAAWPSS